MSGNDARSFPYYEQLDGILGTRAASSPPVVVDSGGPSSAPTCSLDVEPPAEGGMWSV